MYCAFHHVRYVEEDYLDLKCPVCGLTAENAALREDKARLIEAAIAGCIRKLNDTRGFHVDSLDASIQSEFIEDLRKEIRAAIDEARQQTSLQNDVEE